MGLDGGQLMAAVPTPPAQDLAFLGCPGVLRLGTCTCRLLQAWHTASAVPPVTRGSTLIMDGFTTNEPAVKPQGASAKSRTPGRQAALLPEVIRNGLRREVLPPQLLPRYKTDEGCILLQPGLHH